MKVKKMIAPVIITIILILYFSFYSLGAFSISVAMDFPFWTKIVALLIATAFIGVSIFVLVERIKEIRSGEEDDLGKY